LPAKAIFEMTYTVSGGTLNSTHSLTHSLTLETVTWNVICWTYNVLVEVSVGQESVISGVGNGKKDSDMNANAHPELCVDRGLLQCL